MSGKTVKKIGDVFHVKYPDGREEAFPAAVEGEFTSSVTYEHKGGGFIARRRRKS